MTYAEKLKNPKWQKKRLEVLQRDNFTCCLCSDAETTLHVHHKTYKKGVDVWDYPNDNFQTLCEDCHALVGFMKFYITIRVEKMGKNIFNNKMFFLLYSFPENVHPPDIAYMVIYESGEIEMKECFDFFDAQ